MDDSQAFLKAYDDHANALFRYIAVRVSDRELAKDLMQDTFTKTWKTLADGGKIQNLKAFLYKVAHNLIIDHYRQQKPTSSLEDLQEQGFEPSAESPDLASRIDAKNVLALLNRLKPEFREIIVLRYVEDFKPKEIAQILGLQENLVSVRIHRALNALRNLMPYEQELA